MSATIVLASRNEGKIAEIRSLLAGCNLEINALGNFPQVPEIEEVGATLEENALIKARTVFRLTGIPSVADDSGLEVDYLGGEPGVRSARYAGEDVSYAENNKKLLQELAGAGTGRRGARFRCVAAFVDAETEELCVGGCEGAIAYHPAGDSGFGYDPLFIPDGYSKTFAQLHPDEKNSISHRSAAFRKLASFLRRYYSKPAS